MLVILCLTPVWLPSAAPPLPAPVSTALHPGLKSPPATQDPPTISRCPLQPPLASLTLGSHICPLTAALSLNGCSFHTQDCLFRASVECLPFLLPPSDLLLLPVLFFEAGPLNQTQSFEIRLSLAGHLACGIFHLCLLKRFRGSVRYPQGRNMAASRQARCRRS